MGWLISRKLQDRIVCEAIDHDFFVKLMLCRLVRPLDKVEFGYERMIGKLRIIVELRLLLWLSKR